MATPLVAGEAALLFTIARDINGNGTVNDEIRDAIISSLESNTNGCGIGRINVLQALDILMIAGN
jgi:hypothetical protein